MFFYILAVNTMQHTNFAAMQNPTTLERHERLYYRDQLRAARYLALADAEGFGAICFAIEEIGLRLLGQKADMGKYESKLRNLAENSVVLHDLSRNFPNSFTRFDALYKTVRSARNDAMHTGVYARHATFAAIELAIGLEEALMKEQTVPRQTVVNFMVKSPVSVELWQPVAHARQLMLMHSFSFLPIYQERWKLLSEISMVKYLKQSSGSWKELLGNSIENAVQGGLALIDAKVVDGTDEITDVLAAVDSPNSQTLWLIEARPGVLAGVLSPFELM